MEQPAEIDCTALGPVGAFKPGDAYRDAHHVFQAFRFRCFFCLVHRVWVGWGGRVFERRERFGKIGCLRFDFVLFISFV